MTLTFMNESAEKPNTESSFVSKAEKGFVKLRSPGSIGIKFQPNPNVFSFDREGGENKTKFQGPSLNYATS